MLGGAGGSNGQGRLWLAATVALARSPGWPVVGVRRLAAIRCGTAFWVRAGRVLPAPGGPRPRCGGRPAADTELASLIPAPVVPESNRSLGWENHRYRRRPGAWPVASRTRCRVRGLMVLAAGPGLRKRTRYKPPPWPHIALCVTVRD